MGRIVESAGAARGREVPLQRALMRCGPPVLATFDRAHITVCNTPAGGTRVSFRSQPQPLPVPPAHYTQILGNHHPPKVSAAVYAINTMAMLTAART